MVDTGEYALYSGFVLDQLFFADTIKFMREYQPAFSFM
jgi:hypothetical protein